MLGEQGLGFIGGVGTLGWALGPPRPFGLQRGEGVRLPWQGGWDLGWALGPPVSPLGCMEGNAIIII